jgi:hypothetical protein
LFVVLPTELFALSVSAEVAVVSASLISITSLELVLFTASLGLCFKVLTREKKKKKKRKKEKVEL